MERREKNMPNARRWIVEILKRQPAMKGTTQGHRTAHFWEFLSRNVPDARRWKIEILKSRLIVIVYSSDLAFESAWTLFPGKMSPMPVAGRYSHSRHTKETNCHTKETDSHIKVTLIRLERDLFTTKEAYSQRKRPIHNERDLFTTKETLQIAHRDCLQ